MHCLPTTLGIDHRIINGRVYIGGNGVSDPAEIARRTDEFQKRAFYYYANWERLYAQWREKMLKLIQEAPPQAPLRNILEQLGNDYSGVLYNLRTDWRESYTQALNLFQHAVAPQAEASGSNNV